MIARIPELGKLLIDTIQRGLSVDGTPQLQALKRSGQRATVKQGLPLSPAVTGSQLSARLLVSIINCEVLGMRESHQTTSESFSALLVTII